MAFRNILPLMNITVSSSSAGQTKRIDLNNLPVTQVDKSPKTAGIFLLVFASLWGGIPTVALIHALSTGKLKGEMLGLLLFTVIGTGIFIGGLYLLTSSTITTLSRELVSVTRKSLFGTKLWSAPLSSFTGVRSRSEYHSGGKNSPSYTLYIVELVHSDPKKTVRLYESRMDVGLRGIWEGACRSLNLPAVEGDGANLVTRAVEDLDKSVKDLAREGKLQVNFDPSKPPPMGLTLKVDGKFLELTVQGRKGPVLAGGLVGMIFAGIFVFVGFFVKNAPVIFGFVGVLIVLIVLAATIWTLITKEQIRVAKDEIHMRRQTPWGPTNGSRFSTTGVETVRIGKKDNQGSNGILIETDAATTQVGAGLPAPALEWLKNCILKVIAA